MLVVLVAIPVASAGVLNVHIAPPGNTYIVNPGEMVFVDSTGAWGVKPVSTSTDAINDCKHDSVTRPGSLISPLENTCNLTDSGSSWLVGWQYPPGIEGRAQAAIFVGATHLDFTGSNGGVVTGDCTWEWIPRLGQTVSCSFAFNGVPSGSLNADFENAESIGAWWAILYVYG